MTRRHARTAALPGIIAAGIRRAEKARKADIIAKPMRAMFSLLSGGELLEIAGEAVMAMPEIGERDAEYCAIAPAMLGWVDCWSRIAPDINTARIRYLAERLAAGKSITPRLVEQAREEFEQTVARIPDVPDGAILSAITTTQIAWEIEKLREVA